DEQDFNDLHKAMDYATSHFQPSTFNFQLLGATGRREDHTLGNISYLVTFAEEYPGADIEMLTDYGRFVAMTGSRTFASFPRQQVSIFTMEPDVAINAVGLKWPLDGFHAHLWWQATLNEALGTEFSLSTEGHLVVFQTYEPKG
ncbi:MAG: thiamine diphosphokinase, partial [Bacteroidales bacterium]|nr:thiamine diphosphokinase [Bacteroidales bacterium]